MAAGEPLITDDHLSDDFLEDVRRLRRADAAKAAALDDMDSYLDGLQKQFVQAIFESHAAGRIDLQVAVRQ